jgi:fatty-acyl-CoA synthase
MTIQDRIISLSMQNPDALSLVFVDSDEAIETYSRSETLLEIKKKENYFRSFNLPKGSVIPILGDSTFHVVTAFYGAIFAGYVPTILPVISFKTHLDSYRTKLQILVERYSIQMIIGESNSVQQLKSVPEFQRLNILDLSKLEFEPVRDISNKLSVPNEKNDIVFLQHSSGTTGIQKGVAITHNMIFTQVDKYSEFLNLKNESRVISWLPLYHDMGLIACCLLPLLRGIPVVMISPIEWVKNPGIFWKYANQFFCTHGWLPNFAYNLFVDRLQNDDSFDLHNFETLINCSEPVKAESHTRFFEAYKKFGLKREALGSCYAMAENVFAVSQSKPGKIPNSVDVDPDSMNWGCKIRISNQSKKGKLLLSSGEVLNFSEVLILDQSGKELGDGCVGQIVIKGPCVFHEYYLNPESTRAAFSPGGYFYSGDLGFLYGGELFVTGRIKDLIIVAGQNYYPNDIEEIVNRVDGVKPGRVVAFGVENENRGTEDVVVMLESTMQVDDDFRRKISAAIKQAVLKELGCLICHVEVVNQNQLVKTSSGKMARIENRKNFLRSK